MEPIVLRYTVDGDNFVSAGEASTDMKRSLKRLGADAELIRRAAICMYEGEINMVIHGGGGEAVVTFDGSALDILLVDHGKGIPNIEDAMREGFSTATQEVRDIGFGAGMGLPNMKRYADELILESEVGVGTTVKMRLVG
ncbi:MAG: anti-sigma regulatory factor [Oscillospiraceae bacterium]|jgi:anti-sigma regulatory factor (Ser/Thr protein kinase)|nr:anti-sigma regulatory factor [Oscillospiraceae bacterium]